MLTNRQIDRVLGKLKRFETTLEPMLFEPITSLDAQMYETEQNLDSAPVDAAYIPAKKGAVWGGEWKYCWLMLADKKVCFLSMGFRLASLQSHKTGLLTAITTAT